MFFGFSQVLSFLFNPVTWIIILLLLALFLRNKKWAKRCLIFVAIITLFFTNQFIADEAIRLWEYPITEDKKLSASYDVGIVLGGGMVTIDTDYNRMTFRNNTDRIFQAIGLYKTGGIKKMLISSGSGSLLFRNMREAPLLKRCLLTAGIPDSVVIIDSLSDNTHQNAVNSAEILHKEFPSGKFLLITSSYHMRRAIGCFNKAGVKVIPYSTCKITGRRVFRIGHMIIPSIDALDNWNRLIHEVVGYMVYAVFGYL